MTLAMDISALRDASARMQRHERLGRAETDATKRRVHEVLALKDLREVEALTARIRAAMEAT